MKRPLVLLIRDGWGIGIDSPGNAVTRAKMQHLPKLLKEYPNTRLGASGRAVGLRDGIQGSSEVGHLNMGAGRVVEQEIVRVDSLIESGEFFHHPKLLGAIENCRKHGSSLHLMGLVQDQGVHATDEHLYALLDLAQRQKFSPVFIHFFADGRDTPPQSALTHLERLEKKIQEYGVGRIASVMGRYYAMDRGKNWERTKRAYDAIVSGKGFRARSAKEAIEQAYRRTNPDTQGQETDEFIQPTLILDEKSSPVTVKPGDSVIFFNFRQDRAIQLTMAFVEPEFSFFDRGPKLDVNYLGMTRYYDEFTHYVIPPMNMANLVGELLSRAGLWQLRISEYQKYRHVTSFFNGKRIEPYPREDRIQIPSISVPEDTKPEMSAHEVTALAVEAITGGIEAVRRKAKASDGVAVQFDGSLEASRGRDTYDVIIMNYANTDMVGHTGNLEAAVKAVEVVDRCIGAVTEATLKRDGTIMITADHGNVEQMIDPMTGTVQTAHTLNDVDFILAGADVKTARLRSYGILSDVGPTMLELLGIPIPKEMTAASLLEH
jgi:2,3-bisphosphoglycerate-independent phosphoglycerate mutase